MGLGALSEVSLVAARTAAAAARALCAKGIDPIEHAKALRGGEITVRPAGPTFEQYAERYMDERLKRMRSEVHRHQWRQTFRAYCYPIIGAMPVAEIGTEDVLAVLRPIWESRCETASRLRSRIERVLARATVEGHRAGPNPAVWRGHLQEVLPSRFEVAPRKHFKAMDYHVVPAFMVELRDWTTVAARALEFLILTVARTGEVVEATWDEINWTEKTWTVPAEHTKTGNTHIVPLSAGALAVLHAMLPLRDVSGGFIFPGIKGHGISKMTMLALLQRRMRKNLTVHGFRSTFRDWAGDVAGVEREIAEAALAHVVGNRVEAAYRRRTAVERRRKVMQAWCDYCMPPAPSNVVDMAAGRRGSTRRSLIF
jgi:integrase